MYRVTAEHTVLVILFIGNNNSDMWKSILGVFGSGDALEQGNPILEVRTEVSH